MPLHSWLPRAHPIAPAPVSALMSGVMIKVAIYGLVRVLVDWLGVLPLWFGVLVLALGALSAVGGVVYALFQHDLKRLLAFHSIENVGIIVLGLGACLLLRARGADTWAAFALGGGAAAHAQPRGLQGAALPRRGRVRARGRLARARPARRAAAADAVDRRRVPRRRDGDRRRAAAERLRLRVADAAGARARPRLRRRSATGWPARSRSRRSPRPPRSPSSASSRSSGSYCSARRGATAVADATRGARADARRGRRARRRLRRARRRSRAALRLARRPRAVAGVRADLARPAPARHRIAADGRDRDRARPARAGCSSSLRGRRVAAPAPTWACGQLVEPQLALDERRLHQAAAARARDRAAPAAGDRGAHGGRGRAGGLLQRPRPASDRRAAVRARVRSALVAARHARRLQTRPPRHLRRLPDRARARAARGGEGWA